MKKVLLATTALLATAGVAAAQDDENGAILFEGEAKMGLQYGADEEFTASTVAELYVIGAGETDTGLTFGFQFDIVAGTNVSRDDVFATGDLDEDEDVDIEDLLQGDDLAVIDDEEVFVTGPFGTFAMGDVDSAIEATDVGLADFGLFNIGVDDVVEDTSGLGADMLYTGTFNVVSFAVSYDFGNTDDDDDDFAIGVGGEYLGFNLSAGFGLDDGLDEGQDEVYSIGAGYELFGVVVAAQYENSEVGDAYGITGGYAGFGPGLGVEVGYTHLSGDASEDAEALAVEVAYDLGGGASFIAGVGTLDGTVNGIEYDDDVLGDFGLFFEF